MSLRLLRQCCRILEKRAEIDSSSAYGAGIGALAGGGIGALIQYLRGEPIFPGLGIGATAGGLAGYGIGANMSSDDNLLRDYDASEHKPELPRKLRELRKPESPVGPPTGHTAVNLQKPPFPRSNNVRFTGTPINGLANTEAAKRFVRELTADVRYDGKNGDMLDIAALAAMSVGSNNSEWHPPVLKPVVPISEDGGSRDINISSSPSFASDLSSTLNVQY